MEMHLFGCFLKDPDIWAFPGGLTALHRTSVDWTVSPEEQASRQHWVIFCPDTPRAPTQNGYSWLGSRDPPQIQKSGGRFYTRQRAPRGRKTKPGTWAMVVRVAGLER